MKSKTLLMWLAILLIFSGSAVAWYGVKNYLSPAVVVNQGSDPVTDYGPPLEEFTLTQSTGDKFDSKSLDGEIWIANFFYSSCPSICLQQTLKVQEIEQEFGHRGVKFLSITCDAPTDTPQTLAAYAQRFNAQPQRWAFLTGDQKYIERVGADVFKVPVEWRGHTEKLIVVDGAGKIRGAFHFKQPDEVAQLRKLLNELLAEKASGKTQPAKETPAPSAEETTKREEEKVS